MVSSTSYPALNCDSVPVAVGTPGAPRMVGFRRSGATKAEPTPKEQKTPKPVKEKRASRSEPPTGSNRPVFIRLTKGFRGLGVTTDTSGLVVEIDANCPVALAGELSAGDKIIVRCI